MTITYENIAELRTEAEQELAYTKSVYNEAETELVETVGNFVIGAEVESRAYGHGKVLSYSGSTIANLAVEIEFPEVTKKFLLQHIITAGGGFIHFENAAEISIIWEDAVSVHETLTKQLKDAENLIIMLDRKAVKLAEEAKRAEAKFQAEKAKAIKDFKAWTSATRTQSAADEFYYALGWIVKHCGTVSAALPDYLADEFKRYFGPDVPCCIRDSKKKGPSGYTSQWGKSFTISLKKKPTDPPSILVKYLSPKGTAITDTYFVLDLVDNYGFQFGKEQDVEKIRACVPTEHIFSFESGLV
jgi:hypothetical protein